MMEMGVGLSEVLLNNFSLICLTLVSYLLFYHIESFDNLCEILSFSYVLSVWEVRHGSIMALREILTYQGASAGILMPEVSCPGTLFSGLEDKDNEPAIKREREIDLNLQVSTDESEPVLKRPKIEDSPFQMSASGDGEPDVCTKVDDGGDQLNTGHANIEIDGSFVNLESHSDMGSTWRSTDDAIVTNEYSEGKESSEKMSILKNLPQNSEVMNFVKDARTSWLRNCEFLQDCAIRFLCVLSLDRYDLFYKLLDSQSIYSTDKYCNEINKMKLERKEELCGSKYEINILI